MDSPAPVEPKRQVSDQEARQVLREHAGIVHMVINRWFKRYRHEDEDLIAVGQHALLEAWTRWDAARGAFSTIAVLRIRQRLDRWVRRDRDTEQRRAEARTESVDFSAWESQKKDGSGSRASAWSAGAPRGFLPTSMIFHFDGEDHVDWASRSAWLRKTMERALTVRQRQVLELVLQGQTFGAVGAALGMSKQGAEVIYGAAVMNLRRAAVAQKLV